MTEKPILKYKHKSGWSALWKKYFGRKHTVFSMYWFFKHEYVRNEELQKFYFPLDHDNLPITEVPFKYQLQGTWYIQDDDLKYLYAGPLVDQELELLVPMDRGIKKVQRIITKTTPFIAFLSALLLLAYRWLQLDAIWQ